LASRSAIVAAVVLSLWLFLPLPILASAAELPEAPQPAQRSQKAFWAEVAAYAAVNVADGVSTVRFVGLGNRCGIYHRGCFESESPWLYGRKPTAARYFAASFALAGIDAYVSYRLERSPRRGFRILGQGIMPFETAAHAQGLAQNLSLKGM
jgi:hypothetical protein